MLEQGRVPVRRTAGAGMSVTPAGTAEWNPVEGALGRAGTVVLVRDLLLGKAALGKIGPWKVVFGRVVFSIGVSARDELGRFEVETWSSSEAFAAVV